MSTIVATLSLDAQTAKALGAERADEGENEGEGGEQLLESTYAPSVRIHIAATARDRA